MIAMKKCKDCRKAVPELEVFPGPRCLDCHAKWFDSIPLSRHGKPDFVGSINFGRKGAKREQR